MHNLKSFSSRGILAASINLFKFSIVRERKAIVKAVPHLIHCLSILVHYRGIYVISSSRYSNPTQSHQFNRGSKVESGVLQLQSYLGMVQARQSVRYCQLSSQMNTKKSIRSGITRLTIKICAILQARKQLQRDKPCTEA